ncbi:MAG: hypothetical protein CMJ83_18470 [Planctomycetes bacterium]|nr:hypothetical protein [Planctomycetota bacterium]
MRSALLLVITLVVPCAAQTAAGSEAEFVKALAKAKLFVQRGRWATAHDTINKALAGHDYENYVRARKEEIASLIRTCVFRSKFKPADPKTLVSGTLKSFNLKSGKIKIIYQRRQMRDWVTRNGVSVFPARFSGSHTIDIKGASYPGSGDGAIVVVCIDGGAGYSVVFGRAAVTVGQTKSWVPARILNLKTRDDTDYKESSPCRPGKKFSIKVSVDRRSVKCAYNGRIVLSGRKRPKEWGGLGFVPGGRFDSVTVSGQVEPSWLQGLIDAATQKQLAKFDRTYDQAKYVPKWIFEKPKAQPTLAKATRGGWPKGVKRQHIRGGLGRLQDLYDRKKYVEGEKLAMKLGDDEVSIAGRSWMRMRFNQHLGLFEEALGHCRKTLAIDPLYTEARIMEARILGQMGRHDEATAAWTKLGDRFPGDTELVAERVNFLLTIGRMKEAHAVVKKAMSKGVTSKDIEAADRLLVKAESGPRFARPVRFTSQNYEVVSDIDKQTCQEASKILEESYLAFSTYLERVKGLPRQRFRVFLFAGSRGYKRYCSDLWGVAPNHTAGLYTPRLKQLLIWNLPNREAMMRTVRHEGFHQYLDRLMRDPPRWFNEGMAEYWESARLVNGRWRIGQKRDDHLQTLGKAGVMPLKGFLYRDDRTFMIRAGVHYAQSWAFIHFLRHADTAPKGLFDELWSSFKKGPNARAAMDRVFGQKNLDALGRAFEHHVRSLR